MRKQSGWPSVFLISVFALGAQADNPEGSAWHAVVDPPIPAQNAEPWVQPEAFHGFEFNRAALRSALAQAPLEFTAAAVEQAVEIEIPMPDGGMARFRVIESPIMAPELAARFPQIRTYLGQGIDDPAATLRFDITPTGFHAQILSPRGAVYVDPYWKNDAQFHVSYYKRDYHRDVQGFECFTDAANDAGPIPDPSAETLLLAGENLRTYRLAVGATGEYTSFHGGTVAAGMAAIVTAMNRVNGIYEVEVAVRMVLVANNDLVVFTNAGSDPYTNNNGGAMLGENQTTLDSIIGIGNYDIGHAFSTGGGGVAFLGAVCNNGIKAGGITGLGSPIGDSFYVDYVAHEMGHQFDGNHSFNGVNGSCTGGNRNGSTAYEPGGGSTIQAYAGICGADDLQSNSDPYFHSISLLEINAFITSGTGSACPVVTSTGNTPPTVNAGPDYTIPAATPFVLTATAGDIDGDTVTMCWEEADLGPAQALSDPDNGSSPLFRSRNPRLGFSHTYPRNQDLRFGTNTAGEKLPTTDRTMTFRAIARDNRAGGGGFAMDEMVLTVTTSAGPLAVTSPNTNVTWGGTQTVTWNVAGTDLPPVNTTLVDIVLSTDDGISFDVILASSTANDGVAVVSLPNVTTTAARIRVQAVGNVFFDYSDVSFTIEPSSLSIALPSGAPTQFLPGAPVSFDVLVIPGDENIVPGSPTLQYSYDGGAFQSSALIPLGGDLYSAILPAAVCADSPRFYLSADGDGGATVTDPSGAPANVHTAVVGLETIGFTDDFETDQGWSLSGGASDGQWERGIPIDGGRGDPPADADGSGNCYITDNASGNSDVDGGTTTLTSPIIDLTNGGTISFAYWLNDIPTGALGVEDSMTVEVATNAAGTNWTPLRVYTTAVAAWRNDSIEVGVEVAASATIRIRFSVTDDTPGDVVEAGIDAIAVTNFECTDVIVCTGDIDGDNDVDLQDMSFLLSNFGTASGAVLADGDIDGDGDVDLSDLALLLSAFGTACP